MERHGHHWGCTQRQCRLSFLPAEDCQSLTELYKPELPQGGPVYPVLVKIPGERKERPCEMEPKGGRGEWAAAA